MSSKRSTWSHFCLPLKANKSTQKTKCNTGLIENIEIAALHS